MSSLNHVAIIMDGNGRWAKQRLRPRVWGHIRGVTVVREIIEVASKTDLKELTLYAFSTENWSRPEQEVTTLFKLLAKFLKKEKKSILENNLQFKIIGDISNLDSAIQKEILELEKLTNANTGLKLSFAFSYGGRQEIVDAVNKFIQSNPNKEITAQDIQKNLYRENTQDVDLLIRTGGDQRVSNFLLWQMSYAELFFTKTLWPDFSKQEFLDILKKVATRERRFGGLDPKSSLDANEKLAQKQKSFLSGSSNEL